MTDSTLPSPQIFTFRGQPVIRDAELAELFSYTTGNLNKLVNNNADRFGEDFAFRLTDEEFAELKFQLGISKTHGGLRHPPMMYTEHGAVMAATLMRSPRAAEASRFVVRSFVAARRGLMAKAQGQNLPLSLPVNDLVPIAGRERSGLVGKLDAALGRVLDAIADPVQETTVRDEARQIALEGLSAIKAHLKKQDIANEKTLAEVQKLLKEAEAIDAEISARHIENNHRQMAYLAKQLRIVIEVQRYLDQGDVDTLLAVLKDLGT
ncbi:ORF6N domain-containing protein [Tritonibacter mobilis]|jgi:hypothetical protein|nr:ORF6N domain-containing protein [Tritonibacter mobilis]